MPIETDSDGTDDNDGPHCRNCHTGSADCDVCHADEKAVTSNFSAAFTAVQTPSASLTTNYSPQSTIRQSAVTVGTECLSGGFSFPHRTLGKDMLKDELYGIDFDGTPISAGASRTANVAGGLVADGVSQYSTGGDFYYWVTESRNASSVIPAVAGDTGALENAKAENLDSVCIDCHGDSTYYNVASTWTTAFAGTTTTPDVYGYGPSAGYELLLKGLP